MCSHLHVTTIASTKARLTSVCGVGDGAPSEMQYSSRCHHRSRAVRVVAALHQRDVLSTIVTVVRQEVLRGQAVYSKRVLSAYDLVVLGISNRWIWKCPTSRLLDLYDAHISGNHLDVGVGTGYFLDRSRTLSQGARIALMDLNKNSLEIAARRIARFRLELYRRDVLEPLSFDGGSFDSVGINYLLHCLPGSIDAKATALDHLQALMNHGAVLFGSTLLYDGAPRGALAVRLMAICNDRGIFANRGDDLTGLERVLRQRFCDVSVEVVGCAALFSARVRNRVRITL